MSTDNVVVLDRSPVGAFATYQAGRGLSPQTIKRRRVSLTQWVAFCADPFDADGHAIEDWLAQFSSPATRKAYLADLRAFYRWAIRSGRTERDPTVMVDPPRLPTRLPTPLTSTEVHLAVDAAAGDLRLMVMLGAFADLRVSEIAALRAEDVAPPVLLVRHGKVRHRDRRMVGVEVADAADTAAVEVDVVEVAAGAAFERVRVGHAAGEHVLPCLSRCVLRRQDGDRVVANVGEPFPLRHVGRAGDSGQRRRRRQAWINECQQRGVNVYVNNSSGGLQDFMATAAGRDYAEAHDYGYVKDSNTWGTNPRMWFIDDEPEIEEGNVACGTGYRVPCGGGHLTGILGLTMLERGEALRAINPSAPTTINLDGNFKPDGWYAYGQLADVGFVHILLVIAAVVILIRILQGRKPLG